VGHIKKLLAIKELNPRNLTAGAIWTDLCENIHLHYRNIRLEFSELEWSDFRCAVNMLGVAVEGVAEQNDYREGNPNFLIQQLFNTRLKSDTDYFPNRCTIERQADNTVHFHYRDLRLHWTQEEYLEIARMFEKSLKEFESKPFPYEGIKERIRVWIDIDSIQPYDDGHKPGVIDQEHREGIDFVKQLMENPDNKIRPITVNDKGQRMDGFKRYMAHKELGKKQIECIVDPWAIMGVQHNHSFLDDEE
jgi:hypothetical protein